MLCAEIVRLNWTDDEGFPREQMANLDDASACGASLAADDPIPMGTRVVITCHADEFSSRVSYCIPHELGFLVGVEFDAGTLWEREVDALAHLVDPDLVGGSSKNREQIENWPYLLATMSCIALGAALSKYEDR